MALRDHNYVIPANHEEEVGAPNIHLQDHTYAQQLAVVQIQPQQEEDREVLEDGPAHNEEQEDGEQVDGPQEDEQQDGEQVDGQQEDGPQEDEQQEDGQQVDGSQDGLQEDRPAHDEEQEDGAQEPRTYRTIPGIRLNSKFYVDNLGYKYYKKKLLVNKISLICEQQKIPEVPSCVMV